VDRAEQSGCADGCGIRVTMAVGLPAYERSARDPGIAPGVAGAAPFRIDWNQGRL